MRRRCIFQVETARLGALLGNMFFKKQKARFCEPKAVTREVILIKEAIKQQLSKKGRKSGFGSGGGI